MTERKLATIRRIDGSWNNYGNTRGYRYKDETGNRYGKLTIIFCKNK